MAPGEARLNKRAAHATVSVALLLSACATKPSATPTSSPTTTPTATPTVTPTRTTRTVPEIWRFDASLVGGGTIDGADLAGDKVAVWLWAPW